MRDDGYMQPGRSPMGSVGDAYDNAAAEAFVATVKTELVDRYSWPTRLDTELAVFDYIESFYNRRRRHSTLGMLSPEAFESRHAFERKSL